jgi:hypothetical protein
MGMAGFGLHPADQPVCAYGDRAPISAIRAT